MRNAAFWKPWPAWLLLMAGATLLPTLAHAQAWLPDPGRGSLYVGYEYGQAHWSLFPVSLAGFGGCSPLTSDEKCFSGEHYGQYLTVDLDYGVLQGLAVTARLAHVASKYTGPFPHGDQSGQIVRADNGAYHGTLQDAKLGVHLTVLRKPFVATPFVAFLFPLRRYETLGHAVAGHHLRELLVGATLARTLKPLVPDAYAQMTYTYSTAEREADHSIHRNGVDMELGYFVTPRLSLKGAASWIRSSGGIEWDLSEHFFTYGLSHDPLANERSWRVGGGAGYALTPRFQLYMIGFVTLSGANTHQLHTLATGIGWNFATPWAD